MWLAALPATRKFLWPETWTRHTAQVSRARARRRPGPAVEAQPQGRTRPQNGKKVVHEIRGSQRWTCARDDLTPGHLGLAGPPLTPRKDRCGWRWPSRTWTKGESHGRRTAVRAGGRPDSAARPRPPVVRSPSLGATPAPTPQTGTTAWTRAATLPGPAPAGAPRRSPRLPGWRLSPDRRTRSARCGDGAVSTHARKVPGDRQTSCPVGLVSLRREARATPRRCHTARPSDRGIRASWRVDNISGNRSSVETF